MRLTSISETGNRIGRTFTNLKLDLESDLAARDEPVGNAYWRANKATAIGACLEASRRSGVSVCSSPVSAGLLEMVELREGLW